MFVLRSCASLGFVLGSFLGGCAASETTTAEDPIVETPATEPPRAGSGSTNGALAGSSMSVADAVVFVGSISERDPTQRGARIVLTSYAGTCDKPGIVSAGGAVLTIDVPIVDGAPVAGTYSVPVGAKPGASSVVAHLDVAGESCFRKTVIVSAGTLTIDDASNGRVSGNFSFTLGRDTFTGTFDAAPCAGSQPPLALRCL